MENILLCITDDGSSDDQWLHLASSIVEALTYSIEGVSASIPTIHVVASMEACLEIGIGAIGRGETRTLEGGDRRLSSIELVPYREDNKKWDFGDAMLGRGNGEFKENGALEDLAALGAIEIDGIQEGGGYRNRRIKDAIKYVIEGRIVQNIILVGERGAVFKLANDLPNISKAPVICASEDGDIEELVSQLQWLHSADSFDSEADRKYADMEPLNNEDMELKMKMKREAVKEAMQLASVLIKFDSGLLQSH